MRLFTIEEILADATESDVLKRAAERARNSQSAMDRVKREQEAWSEVGSQVVGAERSDR